MSELLKRRRRIAEVEVRCYVSQLVSSLKYLHSQLVIHRDLKLGNLFLDSELRIKVGDFGLAAKLSHPTEKRRTICGTPNYIAPEILEGKEGHSFEVDIWSAGVVMYTLLVGTPPFESKDVKSTYKRILCNSFSFPENILISEDAKHLIRSILQPKPEQRPSLDQIMAHPFFTRPTNLVPSRLPECALFETPQKHQLSYGLAGASAQDVGVGYERVGTGKPVDRQLVFGDENDPQAMNKVRSAALPSSLKVSSAFSSVRRPLAQAQLLPSTRTSGSSGSSEQPAVGASPRLRESAFKSSLDNPFARLSGPPPVAAVPSTAAGKIPSRTQVPAPLGAASEKFEIFVDRKKDSTPSSSRGAGVTKSPASGQASSRPYPLAPRSINQPVLTDRYGASQQSHLSARKRRADLGFGQIGELEQELENVHLNTGSRYSVRSAHSHAKESPVAGLVSGKKRTPVAKHSSRASKHDSSERLSSASASSTQEQDNSSRDQSLKSKRKVGSGSEESPTKLLKQGSTANSRATATANAASTTAHYISPEDPSRRSKPLKTPGTLEAMHEMLDLNCPDINDEDMAFEKVSKNTSSPTESPTALRAQAAHIWVVRYVDFTSKYGLGFLLNTGAAGVYFNDSTKIILSANGEIFQYIERKCADGNANTSIMEHISQTHSIHWYPAELQKKVTLLCHFRNYLMDQTKIDPERDDQGTGMDEHMKLRTPLGHNAAQAASTTVKFGTNSAQYIPGRHDNPTAAHEKSVLSSLETYPDSDLGMVYLKKWVRTKHAILFRLSNRTVQVVFFDRSEVLMSSEVKIITFVSKLGERSYHSLYSVMQSGRKDIAKRLKYTKDIMHRLITIQQPK